MSRNVPRWLQSVYDGYVGPDAHHNDTILVLAHARTVMDNVEAASKEASYLVAWLSRNRERFGLADPVLRPARHRQDRMRAKPG